MGRKFINDIDHNVGLRILDTIWIKFIEFKWFGIKCSFKSCDGSSATKMYNTLELPYLKKTCNHISVITRKKERICGYDALMVAYKHKQIPLCKKHYQLLNLGKIGLEDLN